MPAFLQSFIEAEQERSRRIEQLRKEIREFAKEEAGSSITEQILLFLADEMVEHLSEIDYELRMKFELYITPLIKRNYIYRYTGTFDRIRQAYIRERMKTPAGQRECEWKTFCSIPLRSCNRKECGNGTVSEQHGLEF